MKELVVFMNADFGKVRVAKVDGEPYFCAGDVCKGLGYANPRDAVARYCKGVEKLDTPTDGGTQRLSYIPEIDLYRLAIHSRAANAERFQNWITEDVLPSIRRTGGYIAGQEDQTPEEIVANALIVAQNIIDEKTRAIALLRPKADFYDAVVDGGSAVSLMEAAKLLGFPGIGQNNLARFLRQQRILMDDNLPFQEYLNRGYFRVVEQVYRKGDGTEMVSCKTLIYQKGLDFFDAAAWRKIRDHVAQREPFRVERKVAEVRFVFHGHLIPDTADYRELWKGTYLVYVDVTGNERGTGYATDDLAAFDSYESFIRRADRSLAGFCDTHTPLPEVIVPIEQLSLF